MKKKLVKLFSGILAIAVLFTMSITPLYAAYENDQYIKVETSLSPASSTPELGSTQNINYSISGDEFALDPGIVNPENLAEKDIALVLDISGSMGSYMGAKTRMAVLKESAINFINRFAGTNTKICVVPFGYTANRTTELLSMQVPGDVTSLIATVTSLNATESTNTGDGMRRAYWKLKKAPVNAMGNSKYMILMTDGDANVHTTSVSGSTAPFKLDDGNASYYYSTSTNSAVSYAQQIGNMLKVDKITSLFIGLTTTASTTLESIAVSSGAAQATAGHYYRVTTASDLEAIYSNFADKIAATFPISVSFRDIIPQGVEVTSLPQGFTSEVQPDGTTLVTGSVSDISLTKNDSTGKYSITPWAGCIGIKYNSTGSKSFSSLSLSYADPFGNNKTASVQNPASVNVVDTTAPSAPQGLVLKQNLGNSVEIGWDASSDLSGTLSYEVYRDGILVGTTAVASYTDTGLVQNKAYTYTVKAMDASDNRSDESPSIQVLTKDIDAPDMPSNLSSKIIAHDSVMVSWDAAIDNVGVTGYKIYADGTYLETVQGTLYTATGLHPGTAYQYSVSAIDAAGNESRPSPITVKSNTPPEASAGPDQTVEGVSPEGTQVTLDASASTDSENDNLTYTWTGSFGTVSGKVVNVVLPLGKDSITLKVSDGMAEDEDEVTVDVVDTIPPAITGAPTVPANADGWYNSDVTVHFAANDSCSGVISISPDVVLSDEGKDIKTTGTAVDNSGNSVSMDVTGINIDKTAPVVEGVISASPNEDGWYNKDVNVTFNASDSLSGIKSVSPGITVSNEGASLSVKGNAVDVAGNLAETVVSGINIDKTAPIITIAAPFKSQYKTNETIKLDFSAIDELSGVASCTAVFDGKPAVNGQIINLAQLTGTHSFSVTSVDIAGNAGTKTVYFTVSPIEDGKIKIYSASNNTTSVSNTLYPKFKIVNNGNTPLNLADVKLRYYYTVDVNRPQLFFADYCSIGNSKITGNFVKMDDVKEGADCYVEIGFTKSAGILAPGSAVEFHGRISNSKYLVMSQANDFSFTNGTNYVLTSKTPGYIAGQLEFGLEPGGVTVQKVDQIKIQAHNTVLSPTSSSISANIDLVNTGNADINLSDLKIRYYHTADGTAAQKFWCSYSSVGTANVKGSFTAVTSVDAKADTYLEISFASGAEMLYYGDRVQLNINFAKSDYSQYNQKNDYSFDQSSNSFADNDRIVVLKDGAVVWGIQP